VTEPPVVTFRRIEFVHFTAETEREVYDLLTGLLPEELDTAKVWRGDVSVSAVVELEKLKVVFE
jgi:hypothetical protein